MRRGGIFNSFIITSKGSHICNIHYAEKLQIHIKTDKIHIKADKSTNMQPLMLWMCASLHLFISFTGSTANTTFATHEHIIRELIICFIVRLLLNPKVKDFWKSVNIRRSYGQEYGVLLFWHTGYLLPVASDCQTMELLACACVRACVTRRWCHSCHWQLASRFRVDRSQLGSVTRDDDMPRIILEPPSAAVWKHEPGPAGHRRQSQTPRAIHKCCRSS